MQLALPSAMSKYWKYLDLLVAIALKETSDQTSGVDGRERKAAAERNAAARRIRTLRSTQSERTDGCATGSAEGGGRKCPRARIRTAKSGANDAPRAPWNRRLPWRSAREPNFRPLFGSRAFAPLRRLRREFAVRGGRQRTDLPRSTFCSKRTERTRVRRPDFRLIEPIERLVNA